MKRLIILFGLLSAVGAQAQKMNIGYVYPCGGERGTTFTVAVGGQNISKVNRATVSGKGVTAEIVDPEQESGAKKGQKKGKKSIGEEDNLQIAEHVKVRITIAPDAQPGMRDLRLFSPFGPSNRLFFEVGQLPDVLETEPNAEQATATSVASLPCTINGQIQRSDRDYFTFRASKGDDIVINVKARAFMPYLADAVPGWFQSVLTLYDARGREVAFCDDYMFNIDPVIIFKVPETGNYTLEIHDALYRGREDFVYRIDLGQIPFIKSIFPLGGSHNSATKLQIDGVNLTSDKLTVKPPKESGEIMQVRQSGTSGILSNPMPFELNAERGVTENEKNNSVAEAMSLAVNDAVNGRIAAPGQQDWYCIDVAAAGTTVIFEIAARRLSSPLDAKLSLVNSEGRIVAENDDTENQAEGLITHHADPQLLHKFDHPGRYFLRVIDTQGKGGSEYAYRLHIQRPQPDYDLRIDPSTISIPREGSAAFTVFAIRKHRFNGPIELDFKGLPNGYQTSHSTIGKGESRLTLTVTAPTDATTGKLNLEVRGRASAAKGGETVERTAMPVEGMMQAFYYTHLVPTDEFRVEVTERQPFTLTVDVPEQPLRFVAGETIKVRVKAVKTDGFNEPITLMLRGAQRSGVRMSTGAIIEPEQSEAIVELECINWRPSMRQTVIISGVVKASSKKIPGVAKNTVTSAVTVLAPGFSVITPDTNPPQEGKPRNK